MDFQYSQKWNPRCGLLWDLLCCCSRIVKLIQGSALGPILFAGFIHNSTQRVKNCALLMLADDAKTVGVIGVNLVKLLGGGGAQDLYNLELKQYGCRRRLYRAAEGGEGMGVWGRGVPSPMEWGCGGGVSPPPQKISEF